MKLLIGIFFLFTYGNVLFTQIICNYLAISEKSHIHQDGLSHHVSNDETLIVKHSHKDSNDDNCCNEKTSAFFASQSNLVNSSLDIKNPFVGFSFTHTITSYNFASCTLISFTSSKSPPPKLPDIRVFIQSFLI